MSKYKVALVLGLVIAVVCVVCYFTLKSKCPQDTFSKAAVAADSKKCSETGRNILKQGGSAVDAAISVLLCNSILNPQSAGIGGGSIFTVMDSSGKVKIILSRETVPSNASPNLLNVCPFNVSSGEKWIGVPGEIRGYEKVHKLYGKLPWKDLFQPTIKMAREGITIPPVQASNIQSIQNTHKTNNLWKLFSDENGNRLKAGDTVKFEKLADTLETIANEGAESFYTGKIAEDLVRDVQEAGGILTLQDLASYKVSVTDAWTVPLGEYQMFIPPPPAGGALLGFILNIMKGYQMNSAPQTVDENSLFYHRYIEAFKFGNGQKWHIRDPRFYSNKTAENLIMDSFASNIRNMITNETHELEYYMNISYVDSSGGTTHVSVLAEDGSAVSVTSSINDPFGSQTYSPRTGIVLNNQLADFCNRTDRIFLGERPPSSMAPAILKSQSKILVIGGSGGGYITTGIASALINHLWFGMSLKEAIAAPVIYVDSLNEVKIESKFDRNAITVLQARGQKVEKFHNVVNAVEKEDSCICAVSDSRKHGETAGY